MYVCAYTVRTCKCELISVHWLKGGRKERVDGAWKNMFIAS